jgi:hypothetical protein
MWARQAGGNNIDFGNSIAVDSEDNIYVTGSYYGNATFGDVTFTNGNNWNLFIGKLDSNGNWLWIREAGSIGHEEGSDIKIDNDGNCYVIGTFEKTVEFGTITLKSKGQRDIFVTKLDSNGNWIWATSCGGDTGVLYLSDSAGYIYLDDARNIYITGYFYINATFGNINLISYGYANNNTIDSDIFVTKLDNDGNWLWAKSAVGKSSDSSRPFLTVDNDGNCYISGKFNDIIYFNNSFGDNLFLSPQGYINSNIYIAKLSQNGNWLWAKSIWGDDLCDSGTCLLICKVIFI